MPLFKDFLQRRECEKSGLRKGFRRIGLEIFTIKKTKYHIIRQNKML